MIEKLDLHLDDRGLDIRELVEDKINELIEAYNQHVHYAREMQFPTSTPDNNNPYE